GEAMTDRVVAVEDGHREQNRAELPDAKEDGSGLGRRRQHDRDAIAPFDAVRAQYVRGLICEILELSPRQLALRAVEALPDHRGLVERMLDDDVMDGVVVS